MTAVAEVKKGRQVDGVGLRAACSTTGAQARRPAMLIAAATSTGASPCNIWRRMTHRLSNSPASRASVTQYTTTLRLPSCSTCTVQSHFCTSTLLSSASARNSSTHRLACTDSMVSAVLMKKPLPASSKSHTEVSIMAAALSSRQSVCRPHGHIKQVLWRSTAVCSQGSASQLQGCVITCVVP